MKKIMMTKFGFVRWPEEDFSDDGNRFTCYRVGDRVRVSKLVADGYAYIDARIDGTVLLYEVYGNLPHYKALGKLNGVPVSSLTEQDLLDLCEACLYYEKEYNEAEANVEFPNLEELKDQCVKVQQHFAKQIAEVETLMGKRAARLAMKLTDWEWKALRDDLIHLVDQAKRYDPDTYPLTVYGHRASIEFCKPNAGPLNDTFWYNYLMDILNK